MNVLIVEDEKHTAELLHEIIEKDSDFLVVKILDSISETVSYLSKHSEKIDLLFFDINLSDGHSFEIFKHIDIHIPVVFCTAYDEFTLTAIKNNGIDYILKPFNDDEIQNALHRFKNLAGQFSKKVNPFQIEQIVPKVEYQESFLTQQKEKSVVVKTSDIALFSIEYETVFIYTFDKKKSPVYKNLEYIESVCNLDQFFRINRQMLINRDNIISMEPYFNRKIIINLKIYSEEQPIVSRLKVSDFKKWLER